MLAAAPGRAAADAPLRRPLSSRAISRPRAPLRVLGVAAPLRGRPAEPQSAAVPIPPPRSAGMRANARGLIRRQRRAAAYLHTRPQGAGRRDRRGAQGGRDDLPVGPRTVDRDWPAERRPRSSPAAAPATADSDGQHARAHCTRT